MTVLICYRHAPQNRSLEKVSSLKPGRGRPRKEVMQFIKSHVKKKGDMNDCTNCGMSLRSLSEMYLHVLSVHIKGGVNLGGPANDGATESLAGLGANSIG